MGMVARMYEDNEEERSKFIGYILGGIATGVLIGYPLGGFLFQFVNEASPFVIISLCALVMLCRYFFIIIAIMICKVGKRVYV